MTSQFSDKIIYKGEDCALDTNPLEGYFSKCPDKRPKSDISSSALWRGYVATFEIKDEQLYLKGVPAVFVIQTEHFNDFTLL